VIETSLRVLGKEHPPPLASMDNLAFALKSQRRNVDAIELIVECDRPRKRILKIDHPHPKSSFEALK
jgi:hypothetical protein